LQCKFVAASIEMIKRENRAQSTTCWRQQFGA